jgi:hypothetical protein
MTVTKPDYTPASPSSPGLWLLEGTASLNQLVDSSLQEASGEQSWRSPSRRSQVILNEDTNTKSQDQDAMFQRPRSRTRRQESATISRSAPIIVAVVALAAVSIVSGGNSRSFVIPAISIVVSLVLYLLSVIRLERGRIAAERDTARAFFESMARLPQGAAMEFNADTSGFYALVTPSGTAEPPPLSSPELTLPEEMERGA